MVENVEVKDPLKQGLKQRHIISKRGKINVEVKDPLKQGLKHKKIFLYFFFNTCLLK